MKTAVSIPDDLFDGAEQLARGMRRSRSRVYSEALREYLARHAPDKVTAEMNRALTQIGDESDPFVASASRSRLEQTEW